jgi:tRNA G18 (ribose-2'-O)-methylase SpoU
MLRQVVGFRFHRGMLACGLRRPDRQLADAVPHRGREALIVICVDVRDPTNLGGIIRCAAAFGADAVLVTRSSADPFSRRVLRVSMGAALKLPIVTSEDLPSDLRTLRDRLAVELFAAVLDPGAEPLFAAERPRRLGLLLGNEGDGLPGEIVAACSRRLTIPMRWDTDSLNAAVAGGVFLYHFTRSPSDGGDAANRGGTFRRPSHGG